MSDDWIKMRGALINHPKTIAMARILHGFREFREWLTPGGSGPANGQIVSNIALRCVTCALLLKVWSGARKHGRFDGPDLVLDHNLIPDLDEMGGAPHIGGAMEAVGWAISGADGNGVTLPNFKEYNVPMTDAEKQKAYRKRVTKPLPGDSNEKCENVTSRVDKSRRELRSNSSSAAAQPQTEAPSENPPSGNSQSSSVKEPGPDSETRAYPPVLTFPVVGRKNGTRATAWDLAQSVVDELVECFPGLDVVAECRKALAWVKADPSRRKTPVGMRAFLTRWLTNATDRSKSPASVRPERDQAAASQKWLEMTGGES